MSDRGQLTVLVLGATGSVGSALSIRLAAKGCRLMVGGRNPEALTDLVRRLNCSSVTVEATDPGSIEQAVARTVDEFGRIDGVVNCIGSVLLKPAHLTTAAEWQETIAVNLTSSFHLLRATAQRMRNKGGSIVLISSAAARIGLANHEAIAAAKAGLIGLARSAAATYAGRGVRVNVVAPGLIKSTLTQGLWENPAAAEASIAMHALGRLGEPEDVAAAIDWLLDSASSWITGQVIGVDGGLGSVVPRQRR